MLEWLLEADTTAFLLLNGLHTTWLDSLMMFLTAELSSLPLYLLLLWLAYQKLTKRNLGACLLAVAMVIALADQTTSALMKPYFQRLRPSHEVNLASKIHLVKDSKGDFYRGGKYGFASSHAANTFAVALFFFLLFGKQARFRGLFIWAFLISYTRIYLGVHYPLDIICGALVGMAWAWLFFRLFSKFSQNIAKT
jgi:undecaprenyl-diphosphatase